MTTSPETTLGRSIADAYDPALHGDDLERCLAETSEPLDHRSVHVAFTLHLLFRADDPPDDRPPPMSGMIEVSDASWC